MRALKALIALSLILPGMGYTYSRNESENGRSAQKKNLDGSKPRLPDGEDPWQRIEILIADSRNCPAEFAADLLIQIAESGLVADANLKADLIREAFHTASRVRHSIPRKALPGGLVDTRSGFLSNAFGLGMDGLTLQCRAVIAMLDINGKEARDMFNQISLPKLDTIVCEDPLVHDVSLFYETVSRLTEKSFAEQEIRSREHLIFLENYLSRVTTPAEVAPAAKCLLSLSDASAAEFDRLIHVFSATLSRVQKDYRSFAAPWASPISSIGELASRCKEKDISPDGLLLALRAYIVNQVTAARCFDGVTRRQKPAELEVVDHFNSSLRFVASSKDKEPARIDIDDVQPRKLEGVVNDYHYWASSKAKSFLARSQGLRFPVGTKRITQSSTEDQEWQRQAERFLTDLMSWDPDDEESEEDHFHQKSILLFGLFEVVGPGPVRDRILVDLVTFLADSNLERENPIEWFLHAKPLIGLVRSFHDAERTRMLEVLSQSRSSTLFLYAQLGETIKQR